MPYETRRGEKRTTISVRLDDESLAAVDELGHVWAMADVQEWAEKMGREAYQSDLDRALREGLPRGEVLRRAVALAQLINRGMASSDA